MVRHREKGELIAELLIASDADLNVKNNYGLTPLHVVAGKTKKRPSRWWMALLGGRSIERSIAELLVSKAADINTKDKDGHTPMWHANVKGNDETFELLRQ